VDGPFTGDGRRPERIWREIIAWGGVEPFGRRERHPRELSEPGRLDDFRAPIVCFTMKEDAMQMNTGIDVAIDRENPLPVARIETAREEVVAPAANLNSATVLLHVRFRPDATILNIDECPAEMTKEEWFKRLCARAGGKFATRAGGRGFFRLSHVELETLKVQRPN
jgi:hypothetical protein